MKESYRDFLTKNLLLIGNLPQPFPAAEFRPG